MSELFESLVEKLESNAKLRNLNDGDVSISIYSKDTGADMKVLILLRYNSMDGVSQETIGPYLDDIDLIFLQKPEFRRDLKAKVIVGGNNTGEYDEAIKDYSEYKLKVSINDIEGDVHVSDFIDS